MMPVTVGKIHDSGKPFSTGDVGPDKKSLTFLQMPFLLGEITCSPL